MDAVLAAVHDHAAGVLLDFRGRAVLEDFYAGLIGGPAEADRQPVGVDGAARGVPPAAEITLRPEEIVDVGGRAPFDIGAECLPVLIDLAHLLQGSVRMGGLHPAVLHGRAIDLEGFRLAEGGIRPVQHQLDQGLALALAEQRDDLGGGHRPGEVRHVIAAVSARRAVADGAGFQENDAHPAHCGMNGRVQAAIASANDDQVCRLLARKDRIAAYGFFQRPRPDDTGETAVDRARQGHGAVALL